MVHGLNHITITTSNIDRSMKFYCEILGFKPHVKWEGGAYLTAGNDWVCLSIDTVAPAGDYSHIAFSISQPDLEALKVVAKDRGIEEWKENGSEGDSMYILDPDGHKVELHVGSLQSRLESLRVKPYKNMIWC
jgi:catechol 2,3-dioxygenase-like lactoylglutathione lyase family enzyme